MNWKRIDAILLLYFLGVAMHWADKRWHKQISGMDTLCMHLAEYHPSRDDPPRRRKRISQIDTSREEASEEAEKGRQEAGKGREEVCEVG